MAGQPSRRPRIRPADLQRSAAIAYRKWFRLYSIGTLLTILVLGAGLGFVAGAQIAAQGVIAPPQWFGLIERINIYGFMSWVVVLAIVLLRAEKGPGLVSDSLLRNALFTRY